MFSICSLIILKEIAMYLHFCYCTGESCTFGSSHRYLMLMCIRHGNGLLFAPYMPNKADRPCIGISSNFSYSGIAGSNDNPLSRFRQPTAGGKWLPLCGNIGRIKGCCLLLKIFLIPRANLQPVFLVICLYCQLMIA